MISGIPFHLTQKVTKTDTMKMILKFKRDVAKQDLNLLGAIDQKTQNISQTINLRDTKAASPFSPTMKDGAIKKPR